jgi:hypothetical protein
VPAPLAKRVCSQCHRPLAARFEIVRYDALGKLRFTIALCSVMCVGRWALQYGVGGVRKLLQGLSK